MNERYPKTQKNEPIGKDGQAPDLTGRDYYGVSGESPRANKAWEGREPYPQDVGGINHPGHGGEVGLDPLTGDRGSGEQDTGYRRRASQSGDEAVPQSTPAYSAGEARSFDPPHDRTAEGGFEPRGAFRGWDNQEHAEQARGWWSKAQDEVRAWMGDREAEGRVRLDHELEEREARGGGDWKGHDDDTAWRDPVTDADVKPAGEAPREHRPGLFRDEQGR